MSLLFTFYSGQNKNELFILLLLLSSQRASVTDLFRCKLSFCYSHLSICKKTIYFETPCIVSYLFAQVKVKGLCKYQRSGQISLLPASSSLVNKKCSSNSACNKMILLRCLQCYRSFSKHCFCRSSSFENCTKIQLDLCFEEKKVYSPRNPILYLLLSSLWSLKKYRVKAEKIL